jgi:hypothetical protein
MLLMPVTVDVAPSVVDKPRQAHSLSMIYKLLGTEHVALTDAKYKLLLPDGAVKGRPPAAEPV